MQQSEYTSFITFPRLHLSEYARYWKEKFLKQLFSDEENANNIIKLYLVPKACLYLAITKALLERIRRGHHCNSDPPPRAETSHAMLLGTTAYSSAGEDASHHLRSQPAKSTGCWL
uniref:Uncharacterized protein n=1 Tax=Coccidioides posadasii RMSCC 3488 TaxID=454284 RepID=A0A0J6FC26_COCPO|nr:hypothetical protein CPAG_04156 [Coccidioides posadasii RMSCC 3488]